MIDYLKENKKNCIVLLIVLFVDGCACVTGFSNYFICGLLLASCVFLIRNVMKKEHILKNVIQLVLTLAVFALFAMNIKSAEYMSHNLVINMAKLLECLVVYLCFVMAYTGYAGFQPHDKEDGKSNYKLLFLVDLVMYIAFVTITITMNEAIFSAAPLAMGVVRYGVSVIVLLLLVGGICLVVGSLKVGTLIGVCILALFGYANYFVFLFRGSPITWQDFSGAKTAAAVAGQYSYVFNAEGLIYLIILLGMVTYLVRSIGAGSNVEKDETQKNKTIKNKKHIIRRICLALAGCVMFGGTTCFLLYTDFIEEKMDVQVDVFLPKWTYWRYGEVLSMFSFMKQNRVTAPEDYNADMVEKIQNKYIAKIEETKENSSIESETSKPVTPQNIVVIMNESLADLSIYDGIETNKEVLPFISTMTENTYKGYAVVSPVGGGTCNSEYEFLTGNSMYVTPGAYVYNSLIKENQQSVVSNLESQGYKSLAIHPNKASNWNRKNVYNNMGFDEFWSMEELEAMESQGEATFTYERGMMTDASLYQVMVDELEKQEDNMFIFAVTMQNHGGYDYSDFDINEIQATNVQSDTLNQYLNLAYLSDQAFEELITSLENFDEPTMVVMFGDHQPAVDADIEENIMGIRSDQENTDSTKESANDTRDRFNLMQKRRQTPLVVWTNYESEASSDNYMSLNYLSSVMLERAGLNLTPYNQFLLDMREQIPVINEVGYMGTDGDYHPIDYEYNMIREYAYLVYSQLKDKKHCNDAFYK